MSPEDARHSRLRPPQQEEELPGHRPTQLEGLLERRLVLQQDIKFLEMTRLGLLRMHSYLNQDYYKTTPKG